MSKQLAISCAISVMAMAAFVLYGPALAEHANALPLGAALHLPQLSEFKALFQQ